VNIRTFATAASALALAACTTTEDMEMTTSAAALPDSEVAYDPAIPEATSIFAQPSPLYFHAPQFDRVEDSEWQPIIEEAIAIQLAEIEAIANNPNPPTFANTLVEMQRSGQVFSRAYGAFGQIVSANINDTIAATDEALAPQIAAMSDSIYLNPDLFARVKAVYDNRAAMSMTPEDAMLLETTYAQFVHRGALVDNAQQAELRQINERLSTLSSTKIAALFWPVVMRCEIIEDSVESRSLICRNSACCALSTKAPRWTNWA
jgi:peptidyl-dipeptidase Dcp